MRNLIRILALSAAAFVAAPALADQPASPPQIVRIVVPVHDIQRGETIGDSDLTFLNVSTDRPLAGVVVSVAELNGKEARRFLQAGEAVRGDDVRQPVLVAKGSTVTMIFNAPGITLTATGRATTEGGMGETVTIVNPVSFRQITEIVTGAGTVRAGDVTPVATQTVAATGKP